MTSSLGHFPYGTPWVEGWPTLWATGRVCTQVRGWQTWTSNLDVGREGLHFTTVIWWFLGSTQGIRRMDMLFCFFFVFFNWRYVLTWQTVHVVIWWASVSSHAVIQNKSHAMHVMTILNGYPIWKEQWLCKVKVFLKWARTMSWVSVTSILPIRAIVGSQWLWACVGSLSAVRRPCCMLHCGLCVIKCRKME